MGAEGGGGDRADVTPVCEGEGGGLRGVGATGEDVTPIRNNTSNKGAH